MEIESKYIIEKLMKPKYISLKRQIKLMGFQSQKGERVGQKKYLKI